MGLWLRLRSAQPTVEFYVNDAPIQAAILLTQLYDIGQIEVLRGPQGTLRGRSSPSGSITFTTRTPNLQTPGGYLSMSLSDIGTKNLNGALGLPIIPDILAVRVAGVWDDNDSNRVRSIDPDAKDIDPRSRTKSGRVSAIFQPLDWLKFEGMWQRLERDATSYDEYASVSLRDPSAPASAVLLRPGDRRSIQESPRVIDQTSEILNGRVEARIAGQVLIYQAQQTKLEIFSLTNSDGANFLNRLDFYQDTHTRAKGTSHEIRLQNESRLFGMVDYVVGYFQQTLDPPTELTTETAVLLPPFLGGGVAAIAPTNIRTERSTSEKSVFANLTSHFGSGTQVSGGLRFIDFEQPEGLLFINGNPITTAQPANDEKLIYTASIQHNFTPDLMVYANTGTSRRPGPSIVGVFSPVRSARLESFIDLATESSTSYEAGLKSSWLNNRLIFNLTGFYQKFKNYPFKILTPVFYTNSVFNGAGFSPAVGNTGQLGAAVPVEVKGVEAEIAFKVTPNFSLNMVAAYADGRIKSGLIPCNDLNGDGVPDINPATPTVASLQAAYGADLVGSCRVSQRSSFQSPFSASAQAEYTVPVTGHIDAFARGLFTYTGNSKGDPASALDDESGYGLLNLYAGVREPEGSWEINLFVRNVFDTVRTTNFGAPAVTGYQELAPPTFQTTVGKAFTSTYSVISTTPPREFGVNLRIALGSR